MLYNYTDTNIIINDPALRRANGNPTSVDGVVPNNIHTKSGDSPFKSQASNGPNITDISSHSSGPVTCEVKSQHVPPLQSPTTFQSEQVEHSSVHRVKDIIDNRTNILLFAAVFPPCHNFGVPMTCMCPPFN
ncbi:unnamed protein product [Trichobilharzia szidati]|nr:unnamed protein product [Trichobilharzia szidati]